MFCYTESSPGRENGMRPASIHGGLNLPEGAPYLAGQRHMLRIRAATSTRGPCAGARACAP